MTDGALRNRTPMTRTGWAKLMEAALAYFPGAWVAVRLSRTDGHPRPVQPRITAAGIEGRTRGSIMDYAPAPSAGRLASKGRDDGAPRQHPPDALAVGEPAMGPGSGAVEPSPAACVAARAPTRLRWCSTCTTCGQQAQEPGRRPKKCEAFFRDGRYPARRRATSVIAVRRSRMRTRRDHPSAGTGLLAERRHRAVPARIPIAGSGQGRTCGVSGDNPVIRQTATFRCGKGLLRLCRSCYDRWTMTRRIPGQEYGVTQSGILMSKNTSPGRRRKSRRSSRS